MKRSKASRVARTAGIAGLVVFLSGGLPGALHGGMGTLSAAEKAVKKIAAGKPTYRAKDHAAWETKGRIVGRIRNCPGCEVQALDPQSKKVVSSCTVAKDGANYELQWLEPGTYILLVKAAGYEALDVHNLVVKAKNDLRLNIEF